MKRSIWLSYDVKLTFKEVNSCDFKRFLWQVIPAIQFSNREEVQYRVAFTVYFFLNYLYGTQHLHNNNNGNNTTNDINTFDASAMHI